MSLSNNKQALFGSNKAGAGPKPAGGSTNAPVSTASATAPTPAAPPQSKTAGMTIGKSASSASTGLSAEARQKKMNEAHEYYVKGEENLKTSFFQWKPDHLSAASNFERCGDLYKAADQFKKAIKAYLLSADNYEKSNTLASAALNQLKAADLAKQMGDQAHAVEIILQSAETWALHGDTQKYGETLEKAAKEYELFDVSKAKELHFKAFEVLCPESLSKEQIGQVHPIIIDISKSFFAFLVKNKLYSDALRFAHRMVDIFTAFDLESGICKSMAAITILQIAQGDVVKAQQTYLQEHLNVALYMRSQECDFIDILILACTNQDDDMMDKAKMHPQLNYFDKELQHIVKNLSLFELLETGGSQPQPDVKPSNDSKASLFQAKKAARTEQKEEQPAPKEPVKPVEEAHEEAEDLHDALNNLEIPDFTDFGEEEDEPSEVVGPSEVPPPTSDIYVPPPPTESTQPLPPPTPQAISQENEDEDEIDLS